MQQKPKSGSLIDRLKKKLGITPKVPEGRKAIKGAAAERLYIRSLPKMPPGKWREMEGED